MKWNTCECPKCAAKVVSEGVDAARTRFVGHGTSHDRGEVGWQENGRVLVICTQTGVNLRFNIVARHRISPFAEKLATN
jgi:hypothetical protein